MTIHVRTDDAARQVSTARSNIGHLHLLKSSLLLLMHHPLTGVGSSQSGIHTIYPLGNKVIILPGIDTLNLYLLILCNSGVSGLLILILIIGGIVSALKRAERTPLMIGTTASWIAVALDSMFNNIYISCAEGMCCIGVLLAITILLPQKDEILKPDLDGSRIFTSN